MAHKIVLELTPVEFHRREKFENREGQRDLCGSKSIKVTPVIINFERLFGNTKEQENVFPDMPDKDLFHAVAALYDKSLSEVTEDVIYPAICDKWSRTILLIQEKDDALEDFKTRAISNMKNETLAEEINTRSDTGHQQKETGDTYKAKSAVPIEKVTNIQEVPSEKTDLIESTSEVSGPQLVTNGVAATLPKEEESRFAHVFSDMESTDSDEEEDETDEYMSGVEEFLEEVRKRKEAKERWLESVKNHDCGNEPASLLGIEHRLLACATFEQSYKKPGHKVIHLTLIAVRKRFRKMGLGRFMTRIVRNPTLAGRYDAIVVNADHNAIDFFEKEGFSDDVLVNSKYAEIGDTWFNCKRMCYLPPYQSAYESLSAMTQISPDVFLTELEDLDIKQMELDIALYEEKSLQAYQAQSAIVQRLRKEVILLRARVSSQHDAIQALTKENHAVRDEKLACEKQLLKLRLAAMTNAADNLLNFDSDEDKDISEDDLGTGEKSTT